MAVGIGTSQRGLILRVYEVNRDVFRLRVLDDTVPISIEGVRESGSGEGLLGWPKRIYLVRLGSR